MSNFNKNLIFSWRILNFWNNFPIFGTISTKYVIHRWPPGMVISFNGNFTRQRRWHHPFGARKKKNESNPPKREKSHRNKALALHTLLWACGALNAGQHPDGARLVLGHCPGPRSRRRRETRNIAITRSDNGKIDTGFRDKKDRRHVTAVAYFQASARRRGTTKKLKDNSSGGCFGEGVNANMFHKCVSGESTFERPR